MWSNWLDQEITKRFLRFIDHLRLVLVLTASFLAQVKRADESALSIWNTCRLTLYQQDYHLVGQLRRPVAIKGMVNKCFPLAMTLALIFGLLHTHLSRREARDRPDELLYLPAIMVDGFRIYGAIKCIVPYEDW